MENLNNKDLYVNNIDNNKYPELVSEINNDPNLLKIHDLFGKINENTKESIEINKIFLSIIETQETNKKLKDLKRII